MHIKLNKFTFLLLVAILLFFTTSVYADKYATGTEVFRKSEVVKPFFESAYGYAIFPTVGKAGFGIGGAYGKGRVYRAGQFTGETSLIKATIGFQLGGQAYSEIIFFQDVRAYNDFTSGNFEFDAAASAVAITAGAQAKIGSTGSSAGASAGPATGIQVEAKYRKGMATFIHIKGGLMYEAAIGGQKFSFKARK